MRHQPPLLITNLLFAAFVGEVIATIFFEGTSLTSHGIGVTKIQDQIYIDAMFGRISPTYIWSWDQLWAEVTEVSLQKKRSFSSTSKGLIKFDLSLLHEAWKINNPIMARYVSLFFHSVSSAEPKKTRFRGEAWLIAKTKIEGGKQKPLPIYRGKMLVSGRVLYTFRVFCSNCFSVDVISSFSNFRAPGGENSDDDFPTCEPTFPQATKLHLEANHD